MAAIREPLPVWYDVLDNGKLVLEVWHGPVSRQQVESHSRQHQTDGRIAVGASVLVDARGAKFGFAPKDVQDVVDGLYTNQQRMRIGKCALLVNDGTYELAQAYERSASKYGINVIIFNALDVACEWLGVDRSLVTERMADIDAT